MESNDKTYDIIVSLFLPDDENRDDYGTISISKNKAIQMPDTKEDLAKTMDFDIAVLTGAIAGMLKVMEKENIGTVADNLRKAIRYLEEAVFQAGAEVDYLNEILDDSNSIDGKG